MNLITHLIWVSFLLLKKSRQSKLYIRHSLGIQEGVFFTYTLKKEGVLISRKNIWRKVMKKINAVAGEEDNNMRLRRVFR